MIKKIKTVKSKSFISVVVTMYNSEKYIKECIDSILLQDYDNFELIIVDDGSTDLSCSIVESYEDQRIQLYKCPHNYISSLNYAIRKSIGKYIIHIDADDIQEKTRFSCQVQYMDKHPDIDISGCFMRSFGLRSGIMTCPIKSNEIAAHLLWAVQVFHPSMIFRRDSLVKYGLLFELYDPNVRLCEDYHMLTTVIMKGLKLGNLSETLVNYRTSHSQLTSKKAIEIRSFMLNSRKIYYKYILKQIYSKNKSDIIRMIDLYQDKYLKGALTRTQYLNFIAYLCIKEEIFNYNI